VCGVKDGLVFSGASSRGDNQPNPMSSPCWTCRCMDVCMYVCSSSPACTRPPTAAATAESMAHFYPQTLTPTQTPHSQSVAAPHHTLTLPPLHCSPVEQTQLTYTQTHKHICTRPLISPNAHPLIIHTPLTSSLTNTQTHTHLADGHQRPPVRRESALVHR
jgi:hypothetical protein